MVSELSVSSAMSTLSLNVGSFITLRLNSKNYPLWREQALSLAESQDLVQHLTNSNSAPPKFATDSTSTTGTTPTASTTVTAEYTAWKKSDRLLRGWLIGSLSEESLGLVIGLETAYSVWEALKNSYAQDSQEREFNLRQQITYLRKEDDLSINEHIRKFKEICDSLAAIGKPVPDGEKVYYLLTSLGPHYETFTTTMLKSPRPTYTELVSQLQSLDQRRTWFSKQTEPQNIMPGTHMAFVGQQQSKQHNQYPNSRNDSRFASYGRGFQAQQSKGSGSGRQIKFKRMTPAEREMYKDQTCQYCGVQGHVTNICWWLLMKKEEEGQVPKALTALHLDNTLVETEWTMDTGASNHMTADSGKGYRTSVKEGETQG